MENQNINKSYEEMRKKRREEIKRKRKKSNFLEQVIVVVTIACIGYITYSSYLQLQVKQVVEVFAEAGSLEESIDGKAKIIRNEKVIIASKEGDVEYYYHEGEKIKNGTKVCKIYQKDISDEFEEDIEEIDKQIVKTQNRNMSDSLKLELNNTDEYIYGLIDEYLVYSNTDYAFDVYELKNELKSKFAIKRDAYLKSENVYGSKYVSKRENYVNILNSGITNAYAPMGGIISYYVDGFEENYTPENINDLKGKYLQMGSSKMITGNKKSKITRNEPICKIVDNSAWYITAILDKEKTKNWTINDEKTLRVKNVTDGSIKGVIVNVLEYNKTNIITFKISEQVNKYMAFRDIEIEIIEDKISGLRVPNTALIENEAFAIPKNFVTTEQNQKYIVKYDEKGKTKTQEITPIESDDEYYYVLTSDNAIKENETIVNVELGTQMKVANKKSVYGTYKVVGDIHKYVTVKVLVTNKIYSIIDSNSSNIQLYDKLVLDATMVK